MTETSRLPELANLCGPNMECAREREGKGRRVSSLRRRRPKADRRAAAIGAVVLLREGLASDRPPAKPRLQREPHPHRLIALLERHVPNRAGLTATVLLLLGSAVLGIVKGGHVEEFTSVLSDTRDAMANSAGFRITAVAINGRKQLSQDE